MTTTEEIVVSGDDFIERRIVLCPEQHEIADIRRSAYGNGYRSGLARGLLIGAVLVSAIVFCIWLVGHF